MTILIIAVGLTAFAIGHFVVLSAYPVVVMRSAMDRLSRNGTSVNSWGHGKPADGNARVIVRPSPDLANSRCVYDLSDGPVRITAATGAHYSSVSLYSENSDNFFVVNDREAPEGIDIILYFKGQPRPSGAALIVESPSRTGIALQRRLAVTPEMFAAAASARLNDICAPITLAESAG